MKKISIFYPLVVILILGFSSCTKKQESVSSTIQPPKAERKPFEIVSNGHKRIDNYFWMRLTDEQVNASQKDAQTEQVLSYLNAENQYLKEVTQHTAQLQKTLYSEMTNRIDPTDESVPYKRNGYWYYTRYESGQEYPVYCRKKDTLQAKEEVLLNVNEMAKGHSFYDIEGVSVSEDNNLLVFAEDSVSRRRYTVYVKDLRTGKIIDRPVPNTEGYAVWANDNRTLFYTRKDSVTLRSRWIMKHSLGSNPIQDKIVYEEKDDSFYIGVYKSNSTKYLTIYERSTTTSGFHILEANNPNGSFREFTPRELNHQYSINHSDGKFYILSNDNALNFRLMETMEGKTSKIHWKEKIAHRKDTLLESIDVFKDHLVINERSKANTLIEIVELKTNASHFLSFDETAYTVYPSTNLEFNTENFRFSYTSLITPYATYDYNLKTKNKTLLKQSKVMGGYDPTAYTTERLWATAADGTQIPISIVYKKGLKKDGSNPCLLYSYGSYGSSTDPEFSSSRLSLLDRGFVFAIAHIRGGQEMGRQWYEDGKLFKKKNSFKDFIACTEFLIEEKYTSANRMFANGGSAGGLLMGAIVNMRPDLYKGVIAEVPFVDVVSTMMDETIPLTSNEFDEWGNSDNVEAYMYMLEYSPYDQVKPQSYPNMLVTTGLHDSQVQYWEPAKWVAKLRELKTDDNVLLLRTNMETGHGGTTGRFRVYEELAQEYSFILDLAGIKE